MKLGFYKQKGQGLIETLIIFLFVMISVAVFFKVQTYMTYSTEISTQQGDALLASLSELETLRDFSVLNTTSGYTAYAGIVTGSTTTTIGNTVYTLNWSVTTNTAPNYKVINLTTTWSDRFGGSHSINLTTDVAGLDPSAAATFM